MISEEPARKTEENIVKKASECLQSRLSKNMTVNNNVSDDILNLIEISIMDKKKGDLYAVIFENNHAFIPSLLNY